MWSRGDIVALRDIWFGAVWRAVAGIVVEETPARSVFWLPAGSAAAYPIDGDGNEIRLPRPDFRYGSRRTKKPVLVVCDEGAPWTIWLHFSEGSLDYWYVNFERYLGRSAVAYDCVDHKLDLIVRADGELVWKDEDELERAGSVGLVDVDRVRRDADRATGNPPWPTGWEDYRPDPAWRVPELPEGWDRI